MFLQTPTQVVNTATEKHVFSLWEILFSGGIIGNTIMIAIFLTGILALYIFLERYFFIKRASKETPNFLENIKDFVQEGKIQTAVDYCRTIDSPEARMIEKGLARIGRPISDISNAMQNQGQLEVSKLEKNLNILASASGAAPMLGFLGTVVGMIMAFFEISNVTDVLIENRDFDTIVTIIPSNLDILDSTLDYCTEVINYYKTHNFNL